MDSLDRYINERPLVGVICNNVSEFLLTIFILRNKGYSLGEYEEDMLSLTKDEFEGKHSYWTYGEFLCPLIREGGDIASYRERSKLPDRLREDFIEFSYFMQLYESNGDDIADVDMLDSIETFLSSEV